MKPWKVVLLILFVLAIAAAVYGLILVQHGFSALATPSAIEELAATTARKLAVPSSYRELRNPIAPSTENAFGEAWSISPFIAPRAIRMTDRARRYTARASIRNRPTCAQPGRRTKAMANSTTQLKMEFV
jgi:hypothetical protein